LTDEGEEKNEKGEDQHDPQLPSTTDPDEEDLIVAGDESDESIDCGADPDQKEPTVPEDETGEELMSKELVEQRIREDKPLYIKYLRKIYSEYVDEMIEEYRSLLGDLLTRPTGTFPGWKNLSGNWLWKLHKLQKLNKVEESKWLFKKQQVFK
jgi:hypothetical protein